MTADGYWPHQFPRSADPEAWIIAWVCQACGHTVHEYGSRDEPPCPIDWRKPLDNPA